jgi:hypothetical protein
MVAMNPCLTGGNPADERMIQIYPSLIRLSRISEKACFRSAVLNKQKGKVKQLILVVLLASATSASARLGNTRKEFEQAHRDLEYKGESPGDEPNTMVRQYARENTIAQIIFGTDGKVIMEAYSDLSKKFPVSSLVPVAKSYGYNFSALQKISVSVPWKALVLHRDFWFSADHKFCIGIGDVVMDDSKIASTMTVAGEQVAPTFYQNSH